MQTLTRKPAGASRRGKQAGCVIIRQRGPDGKRRSNGSSAGAPAARRLSYADGEKLFTAKGCIACHSLQAVNAPKGMVGPNLANVGARSYIAAGTLKNTDENLARWIRDPQGIKKGVLMPNLGVTRTGSSGARARISGHISRHLTTTMTRFVWQPGF